MRTSAAQIGAVAPWLDVTNSYQRYWIRAHRWKIPDYLSEYPPEPFPPLPDVDVSPADVIQQRAARNRAGERSAPTQARAEL